MMGQGKKFIVILNAFSCWMVFMGFWAGKLWAEQAEDIRDIRPPVEMPYFFLPWLIALGCLLLIAASVAAVRLFLTHQKKNAHSKRLSAWEIACQCLEELQAKNYPARGLVKEYYSELSDILRKYIEARFALNAPDMTTEEFLDSLKRSEALNDGDKVKLARFLTGCDLVKFAKYSASAHEMDESLTLVRGFISGTQPAETT